MKSPPRLVTLMLLPALLALLAGSAGALHQDEPATRPSQPGRLQPPQMPAGNPNQGFLGGRFAPVEAEIAEQFGVDEQDGVITIEVIPDSPAQHAGLAVGDILKKIDDTNIPDVQTFRQTMSATKPGQTINLTVLREKQEKELPVTLGTRPPGFGTTRPATRPG
jgi:S1-C subfamily serine protease